MILHARQFSFQFPRPALLMGIVNVTPDSFSDGGLWLDPVAAADHAHDLVRQGADLIDVGGESTRPGASPVPAHEELRRVLPVIQRLARELSVPISIDTQKTDVARAALDAGAALVNDVAAHRADDALWRLVAETRAGYVCMHMQGTPKTMQTHPAYDDVVATVDAFFADRLARLQDAGVPPTHVALDVGIGFGKNPDHNLRLLNALPRFTRHQRPLLLGVSRKSFLGRILGGGIPERLPGALACTCWAVSHGVQIIRTHDVAATRNAVRLIEAIQSPTPSWT